MFSNYLIRKNSISHRPITTVLAFNLSEYALEDLSSNYCLQNYLRFRYHLLQALCDSVWHTQRVTQMVWSLWSVKDSLFLNRRWLRYSSCWLGRCILLGSRPIIAKMWCLCYSNQIEFHQLKKVTFRSLSLWYALCLYLLS
jgi:hypothetical protein